MIVNPYLEDMKREMALMFPRITPKQYGCSAACSRNQWRKKTRAYKMNNRKG